MDGWSNRDAARRLASAPLARAKDVARRSGRLRSLAALGGQAWRRTGITRRAVLGLGRREPVSRDFGWDRGRSIDRVYIERFLESTAAYIKGTVLEIKD